MNLLTVIAALAISGHIPISADGGKDVKLSFDDITGPALRYSAKAPPAKSGPGEIHCAMYHGKGVARAGDHWDALPHAGTIKFVGVDRPKLVSCRVTTRRNAAETAAR